MPLTVRMEVSSIVHGSMLPTPKLLVEKLRRAGRDTKVVTNKQARANRRAFVREFGLDHRRVTCLSPGRDGNDEIMSVLPRNRYGIGTGFLVSAEAVILPVYQGQSTAVLAPAADCSIWALTAERPPNQRIDMTIGHLAVVHYGWRQALQGLLSKAYTALKEREPGATIAAIVSPTICEKCYRVRADVFEQFLQKFGERVADLLWVAGRDGHNSLYALDLLSLGLAELVQAGPLEYTSSGGIRRCTLEDPHLFSQRATNQGKKPWGRMGVLVIAS